MGGFGSSSDFDNNWWLGIGERIVWQGSPDPAVSFSKGDIFLVPFSIFWTSFIVFWEVADYRAGWVFGGVFGIPFLIVGAYFVVGRFFYRRWDRRFTRYVLTDRRAVILRRKGQSLQEAPIGASPVRIERSARTGRGSIIWSSPAQPQRFTWSRRLGGGVSRPLLAGTGWPGTSQLSGVAFVDVDDFDPLIRALNQLRAPAPDSAISRWGAQPAPAIAPVVAERP